MRRRTPHGYIVVKVADGRWQSGQPYRGGNNQWRNDGIRSARQQQEVPA